MMAEGQQEDRGFGCGATDRNLILVLSRCSIIPKFDLFRLESWKSPSFRASNQISPTDLASYSKHPWIMGTLQLLLPWFSVMTHASHSIWARRRPPGPASCPAPPGPLPACGSEQCCSQWSPPQKRERPPAWLQKSGDYHLCSRTVEGFFGLATLIWT